MYNIKKLLVIATKGGVLKFFRKREPSSVGSLLAAVLFSTFLVISLIFASSDLSAGGAAVGKGDKQKAGGKAEAEKQKQSTAWVKICDIVKIKKDEKSKEVNKKVCLTHHERLDGNSGFVIVSAAVRDIEGQEKKQLLVMVPLGMSIQHGIFIKVDERQPIKLKYSFCHARGCTAEMVLEEEVITTFKKGAKLTVISVNIAGKAVGFPVPLTGFTKAYGGQAVNAKDYQQARRKLMELIRQRQIERQKKAAEEQQKKAPEKK